MMNEDEDPFLSSFFDIPMSPSDFLLSDEFMVPAASSPQIPDNQQLTSTTTTEWTRSENKLFENAIAELDINSADLFVKIALKVPGKSVEQIEEHYRMLVEDIETIDSGSFPLPEYVDDQLIEIKDDDDHVDGGDGHDADDIDHGDGDHVDHNDDEAWNKKKKKMKKKKGKATATGKRFRRKGVPWTEEEHSLFLAGLGKYGKGDWRSISRYYVITKTPTQVASHAQKYYLRLSSPDKNKNSSSIAKYKRCDSFSPIPLQDHNSTTTQQQQPQNYSNMMINHHTYLNGANASMMTPYQSNLVTNMSASNATNYRFINNGVVPSSPFPLQISPQPVYQQQPPSFMTNNVNYDFIGTNRVPNRPFCGFSSVPGGSFGSALMNSSPVPPVSNYYGLINGESSSRINYPALVPMSNNSTRTAAYPGLGAMMNSTHDHLPFSGDNYHHSASTYPPLPNHQFPSYNPM